PQTSSRSPRMNTKFAALALLTLTAITPAHALLYSLIDLGDLGGSSTTPADAITYNTIDINNSGQIIGTAGGAYKGDATGTVPFGAPTVNQTSKINASGQVAANFVAEGTDAFFYSGGTFTSMGDLGR